MLNAWRLGGCLVVLTACGGEAPNADAAVVHALRCIELGGIVDTGFAINKASDALAGTYLSGQYKAVRIEQGGEGMVVRLVPSRPTVGGGGLVWIDGNTGCPVILKRYE